MKSYFTFTSPIKHFEIEEKGKKRFFIKGDFSNTERDLVDDICTMNCLKSMVRQLKGRSIKLDFEHETLRGEKDLEKAANRTRLPLGKAIEANMRGSAAEAVWELNEDYKKFDEKGNVVMDVEDIKSNVKSEMLDGFSIGYIPTKVNFKNINGEQVRLLEDVNVLTIALTGSPINTTTQVRQVFVKSLSALEEFDEERKNNPDIENFVEIKTSPQERRTQARNEAISEDEEDEEKTYGRGGTGKRKKKENKAYEKDGAHAHTEDEPLGLHNHPEIENEVRGQIDRLDDRINFLSDRLFDSIQDESSPAMAGSKAKIKKQLREELKVYMAGGGDKFFRDGKEIDPKTGEPIKPDLSHSSSSEDLPNKLEDNTMSEKDNAETPTPEESPEEPAKPEEPKDEPEEPEKPAEPEGKAMSEIESLSGQVSELKSQVEALTKALKKPVEGAIAQDTTPKAEIKSEGPTSVLELCK